MGFFSKLFGFEDDVKTYDINDYIYNDDDDATDDDDDTTVNTSVPETKYYSIAKIRIQGVDNLDEDDKDFVMNDLEEDMHVYLRNEFDNPKDCHALQVYHHGHLIGYIDSKKSELIHSYLREGEIGAVTISKIKSKDFKLYIDVNVYYEDRYGTELTPYYPLENRKISVLEPDLWTGQEDWSPDWFLNIFTDELMYKYKDLYDSSVDDKEKESADWELIFWINSYLDGTCITRKGCNLYLDRLTSESAKKVLMTRMEKYLECKGFHFAEKELFSDDEEDGSSSKDDISETPTDSMPIIKQYDDTYVISYKDSQGKLQDKTIKNSNINSFIAGIKYRDNYKNLISKLSEGMRITLRPEPENSYDSNAIGVYNGEDHLGYIPQKDIPAVALNMEEGGIPAIIDYKDEESVDLIIPVTFHKLEDISNSDLENYHFYKREKVKYSGEYVENSTPITKDEFLEGIKTQITKF